MFKNKIKKILLDLGFSDFTLFKKKIKKNINKKFYKKKYTAIDLVNVMKRIGLKEGSIVFVHSSMTEFYNFKGNPKDIIDEILSVIGENGTLLMPSYPVNKLDLMSSKLDKNVLFDASVTPSGAGFLTEIFRKYPGVKRSINMQHSVCAIGKYSDYFTSEHHLSETAWDKKSPYYKICQFDNSYVFTLGLPDMIGTIIHCVESLLKDKYLFFSLFFTRKISYNYVFFDNKIYTHTFYTHELLRKTNKNFIKKILLNDGKMKIGKISNLQVKSVDAKYTLNKLLECAESGQTIFRKPNPKKYKDSDGYFKLI